MKNLLSLLCLCSFLSSSAQISFTNLPNQPPDNIISIITDPTNNDVYAAATLKVIRSVNNGTSYTLTANTGAQNLNLIYFTAAGQLYAGADKTNTSAVGLVKYNKVTNVWSEVAGSPQDITAIVEDNTGNLILGTGTTGNYTAANPINKGNGFYYYNIIANTFTAMNTGLANVPTYPVLPFIKSLAKNSTGVVFAATYGGGIYKLTGTTWAGFGTGLNNPNISALKFNSNDSLYAGTDVGVSVISNAGVAWSNVSTGLPANKPVRSITIDAAGKLYAGLGFYHYQLGNMAGDIYASVNNGTSWQNTNTGYVGGIVFSILAHPSGNVFAGSAGIWKTANNGGLWAYAMSGVKVANQTIKMVQNAAGDMFILCRNNLLGTRLPFGGVFRSTDNGITWVQIVNGINAQGLDELFADGQNNIWVSGKVFKSNANGTGTVWGTPELYKSTNNGNTWVKNTSIVVASDSYNYLAETKTGKLYVASSFGNGQTNLSSSTDYNTFDNTLSLPPTNGNHSFGLVVNNNNYVFHGTETAGLRRSVTNGAAGSFSTITVTGANTSVNIDPITQNIYCNVGNVLTPNINLYCSNNNGNSFFPLNNFPQIWANADDMVFTNTGKIYTVVNSSHFNQVGLYLSQSPITTSSAYTLQINFGTFSFYFNTLYLDKCGYLYGVAQGGGISVSTLPVNTPLQSTLNLPANNATGVSLAPTLSWTPVCSPDSFRVQIALDTFFTGVIIDQSLITTNNYNLLPGLLNPGTKYFWRVYGVNAAGAGQWSKVNSFTTVSILPLTFISFDGTYHNALNTANLNWVTANEINTHHFIIERSTDGIIFTGIGTIVSSAQLTAQNNYSFQDKNLIAENNYYRITQVDKDGKYSYSKIIVVNTKTTLSKELFVFPNPAGNICTIQIPDSKTIYSVIITDEQGGVVFKKNSKLNEKNITVKLNRLSPGTYFVKLTDLKTNLSISKKIFKY